jgi:hypothetical protein
MAGNFPGPHTALRKVCWAGRDCGPLSLLSMERTRSHAFAWPQCRTPLVTSNLSHTIVASCQLPQVEPVSSSFSLRLPSPTFSSPPPQLPPGAFTLHFTRWKRAVATTRHCALILSKHPLQPFPRVNPNLPPGRTTAQSLLTPTTVHASLLAYQSSL